MPPAARSKEQGSLLFASLCLCRLRGCSAATKTTVTASSLDLVAAHPLVAARRGLG